MELEAAHEELARQFHDREVEKEYIALVWGEVMAGRRIDLPIGRTSGLIEAMRVVGGIEGIAFIRFDDRDVVRHKLVQQIVKAYEAFSSGNIKHA